MKERSREREMEVSISTHVCTIIVVRMMMREAEQFKSTFN